MYRGDGRRSRPTSGANTIPSHRFRKRSIPSHDPRYHRWIAIRHTTTVPWHESSETCPDRGAKAKLRLGHEFPLVVGIQSDCRFNVDTAELPTARICMAVFEWRLGRR